MGKRGPEPGSAYGAAAIANAVRGVDFPITKRDLIDQYGDKEIEYTKGNLVRLSDVLGNIENDTFNSPADLEHAFHEKMG